MTTTRRPRRPRRPILPAEQERMLQLYRAGANYYRIGKILDRHEVCVARVILGRASGAGLKRYWAEKSALAVTKLPGAVAGTEDAPVDPAI